MDSDSTEYKPSNRELVELHSATVFRVAYAACKSRADAEDIMQEVFLRLVRTQPELASSEHAKAWLLRVTTNCCASHLRQARKTRTSSLDELQEQSGDSIFETAESVHSGDTDPVATAAEASEQRESVLAAVMKLPPRQRLCIHLHYFEDQSIAQIAATTYWPQSTIKSHLRRGREALSKHLSEEYDYAH